VELRGTGHTARPGGQEHHYRGNLNQTQNL
jgi:hypothetical protein